MPAVPRLVAALPGRGVGEWSQGGVRPIQLADFRGRAPCEVPPACFGEKVVAAVFQAVGEVEAGRTFGDEGSVPWTPAQASPATTRALISADAPSCVMSTAIPSRRSPRAMAPASLRSSSATRIRIRT